MKELTIEQKAKAYDEAKARMSRAFNSNRCTIGFMNEIFPELKESEDEKIRRFLIKWIQDNYYHSTNTNGIPTKTLIAWLEKQNTQSDEDMIEALRTEYEKGRADAFAQMQKDWSKEDENTIKVLTRITRKSDIIDSIIYTNSVKEKLYDWLTSLKYRIYPQPKQKWSEEDEKILKEIISDVKFEGYNCDMLANSYKKINWLKSIKDRVIIQQKQELNENNKEKNLCERCLEAPVNSKERAQILAECKSQSCWFKGY